MRHGIVDLKSVHARDIARSGGKGSGLAKLCQYGFDVPDGFVIGTPVFDELIGELGVRDRFCSPPLDSSSLESLRGVILNSTIPDAWRRPISSAYRKLGGSVAVRSSMVGEDGTRTSLAGQLETVLNVSSEDELLESITRCYASICSSRLQGYLVAMADKRSRSEKKPPSLALVVQRMTTGLMAGVSFSADPQTGRRCVIIEAAPGNTNAVADGAVEPMRWIVDARGVLVNRHGANGKNTFFTDSEVLRLARAMRKIEASLGGPQDVEWIWDGEKFMFLQTRPITTLYGKTVYSNTLVSDMSPGLIKPLLWSTNTLSKTTNVFGRIFSELIGPNEIDFHKLSRRIHSRVYTNMTMLGEILQKIGLPANFFEMLARDETGERPPVKFSVMHVLRHGRMLWFAGRRFRARRAIADFAEAQNRILDRYRNAELATADARELMEFAEDLMNIHGNAQWHVFMAAVNMMIRKRILDHVVKKHAPGTAAADLLSGFTHMKSLEPNFRFEEMAGLARHLDGDALQLLVTGSDESIREYLDRSDRGRELIALVNRFTADYGFLSASGTDFSTEAWVERPELVWQNVARLARRESERTTNVVREQSRALRQRLGRSLGLWPRLWFKRLLRSTVEYMDLRERTSLLLSEDAYHMRRVFLELGRRLRDGGLLGETDDIFYLYIEELRALIADGQTADNIKALVTERQREMEADARIEPLDTVCGDEVPPRAVLYRGRDRCFAGIGGSPGIAEGRAVIVLDPSQAPPDLTRRDILVVPYTDIGWTPLFVGIGGIVAETGGQLSHTCIVAREYNLPAVVSLRGATRLFEAGQPITIDGNRGHVHLGHILSEERRAK